MTTPAFQRSPDEQLEPGHGACLWRWQGLLGEAAGPVADRLYRELPWEQPRIRLYGSWKPVPRLQSWHGDPGASYRYSGLQMQPAHWHPALSQIREQVQKVLGLPFNSVLANLYRDGQDAMGWHADDEPELGPEPWIASYSMGATRRFSFRPRDGGPERLRLDLLDDELLLMNPAVQRHWQHALPRTRRCQHWRINLTFRQIQA